MPLPNSNRGQIRGTLSVGDHFRQLDHVDTLPISPLVFERAKGETG